MLSDLRTHGAAGIWPGSGGTEARWVGIPGMSAMPGEIAGSLSKRGVSIHVERHAAFLHETQGGWRVRHLDARSVRPGTVTPDGGELSARFDALCLAIPAPQAIPLLSALGHADADALKAVSYAPCWAIMTAFSERMDRADTQKFDGGPLRWVARQSSLPGRSPAPDAWVLHADPAWSRDNLEREPDEVADEMLAAFAPTAPQTLYLSAHRWRYALVETPLGRPCLWDPAASLGVCGDFCLGPRIEAAWQSGTALASSVVSHT
jgi:predicted NAD/FAD-dependent oxidoreductase